MKKNHKILITGGAGFIGSEFVRQSIDNHLSIVVVDKLTYAGDLKRLKPFQNKYKFFKADISNAPKIDAIIKEERPNTIVHFAAESHVDRSLLNVSPFIATNIQGTQNLINSALKYKIKQFLHISTDEVYGDILIGKFHEKSPLNPKNPYSASKAAAEYFVQSAMRAHHLPAIIIRPANNYGPWQYPEKFVPVIIFKTLKNQKIPVYGKGAQIREWLHVSDCCKAVNLIMQKGKIGEIYNVGANQEQSNIETVRMILKMLQKPSSLIKFVKDRPGHDFRYAVDDSKLKKLGWKPKILFHKGIQETITWYANNPRWLASKFQFLEKYWKTVYKN